MASLVNHLQKALRHHAPMIRFRYGLNQAGANSSTHALSGSKNGSDLSKNIAASSPSTNQSKSTKKSTPLEFSQTPKKYRRRPLTQDEIDLVTVGGFT